MAEFSTRTIVPADGVKLPAVNENLANPSGNMTLSSLKSYVLGTLPTDVQTNTEDIGENTSDIEGIRGSSQAFDATAAYSAGDYCIYENVLYRFTSAKSAGAWDSAIVAVVDLPTLDGAITSLSNQLGDYDASALSDSIFTYFKNGIEGGIIPLATNGGMVGYDMGGPLGFAIYQVFQSASKLYGTALLLSYSEANKMILTRVAGSNWTARYILKKPE